VAVEQRIAGGLSEQDAIELSRTAGRVRDNIARVLVGKNEVIDLVLVALLSEGHILLEDVPGIGKTTLAKAVARSLSCSFKRIQFTPDLIPSDVTGINFYNQRTGEFEFRPGPISAHIILADEINRATPRTQSALLEAMEERQVTTEGVTLALPQPFLVIATQNPIELEGTFPLPEAQIDRFLVRPQDTLFQTLTLPAQLFPDGLILAVVWMAIATAYAASTSMRRFCPFYRLVWLAAALSILVLWQPWPRFHFGLAVSTRCGGSSFRSNRNSRVIQSASTRAECASC